jgi:succinate dehydrogenase / fumarate reductase flavoprotein subunit
MNDATGGLVVGSPRNQQTNIPGLYVIGEADYHYHGANRLGANSLLSCIFGGLIVGPGAAAYLRNLPNGSVADVNASVFTAAVKSHEDQFNELLARQGDENPYLLHRELGEIMTNNLTVVRRNEKIRETLAKIDELSDRYKRCSLSDKGRWTNQSLSFARAVGDMLTLARVIAQGALQRDECRGAHYKPEFDLPAPHADEPDALRKQAEQWCRQFAEKNEKWLKTTIAEHTPDGPKITYEPVNTSLIPPRPRTYGLKGAEIIEEVWKEMQGQTPETEAQAGYAAAKP